MDITFLWTGFLKPLGLALFCYQVVLSGLSIDVGEAELMRFFSKQGASGCATTVAWHL